MGVSIHGALRQHEPRGLSGEDRDQDDDGQRHAEEEQQK
jgi:hypothetical protein